MSLKQLSRLDTVRRVSRREMSQEDASALLHVTDRTVRAYVRRLEKEGPGFVRHGLCGRPSNNSIPKPEVARIERLLKARYPDFGAAFASEKLAEENGIVRDPKTIRRIQVGLGLWKPRPRRKAEAHREWRERRASFGELEQFDGSYHDWFEGRGGIGEACLLMAVDDATGAITDAQFAPHEGVLPVMGFWLEYARLRGLPKAVYLDRFSTYSMNVKSAAENPDTLTQFERAAREAGVEVIHAHSPQAKGRVERDFQTLQDRLVKELRLRGIDSVTDANAFLRRTFIPAYARKFAVAPAEPGDLHRRPSARELRDVLPLVFCRREARTVQNDFTVLYKRRWLQLTETPRLAVRPGEAVRVHELPSGEIRLTVRGKEARFRELPPRPPKASRPPEIDRPESRP
jgi:transposase